MPDDHGIRFVTAACAGLGLILAACGFLATRRAGAPWRFLAVFLPCGGAVAFGGAWTGDRELAIRAGAVLFTVATVALVIGSRRVTGLASRVLVAVGRPTTTAVLLGGLGLASVVGSIVWYEREDARYTDAHAHALGVSFAPIPLSPVPSMTARTDLGRTIPLRVPAAPRTPAEVSDAERLVFAATQRQSQVIRLAPGNDGANCHGWVFTGGRYIVAGADVDQILRENGYATVTDPRPGDVVLYRYDGGDPSHTGVVRYVTPGQPILVEGKWDWMGVYLHPIASSPYGTKYTFYRSPRSGHVLAGLATSDSPAALTSP